MKYRKILLFILILFFILIIHNNCNAIVLSEGGISKYYLPDLSSYNEDGSYNYVFLFSENNSYMLMIEIPENNYLGYYAPTGALKMFNNSKKSTVSFNAYSCNMTLSNSLYIGDKWDYHLNQTIINVDNSFKYINGTGHIYPCDIDKSYVFTDEDLYSTITNIKWNEDFIFSCVNNYFAFAYPSFRSTNNVFVKDDNTYKYRTSLTGSDINFTNYTGYYNVINPSLSGNSSSSSGKVLKNIIYTNKNILDINGNIVVYSTQPIFKNLYQYNIFPYFLNSVEDLSKGNDDIVIMPGDFTSTEDIKFVIQKVETVGEGDEAYERHSNVFDTITLNATSNCYRETENGGFFYVVPWSFIKDKLVKDTQYVYVLNYTYEEKTYTKELYSTYGGLTDSDIIQNSIDNQTKVFKEYYERQETLIKEQTTLQEEQNETSKGIWGTLKEVLSYINPFSENFFVYKLIELLINALKSLFIPEDGFLNNYFNELKDWFSVRLGFLAYPLDLILDVLERIKTINFEEPIIQIPDFIEPSTNEKIIGARTYNLNSLLENNTFKTCHDVYFVLVDAIIIFGLVNLLKNKLEEVFTK